MNQQSNKNPKANAAKGTRRSTQAAARTGARQGAQSQQKQASSGAQKNQPNAQNQAAGQNGQRRAAGQNAQKQAAGQNGQKQAAGQNGQKQAAGQNAQKQTAPSGAKKQQRQTGTARRQGAQNRAPELRLYPLGGLGEVGKNMTVYECNGDMVIVDCGSLFPDSDMFGVDLVIPDFAFAEQNRDKLRGIVITHGHEDHIGALPYFLREMNLPIYATRLTRGLIENKLEEHGLRGSTEINLIAPGEKFKLGCFTFDPINVNHSIPDAVGFAIDCPAGVVVHTGDFKIDYTPISGKVIDLTTLAEYGEKGVLALLSDSTNSERPGMSSSESKVNENLQALFNKVDKQRIIIASFASNIYRIQHIVDLAVASGRVVAISGRSMINNTRMAMELGYIKAKDDVFIDVDKVDKYPPEKVVIITTGSQGEALSALSRMSTNSHRNVHVGPGDFIIISATPIPGNEKMVTKVINGLLRLGAEVYYERMYDVHASGHACQEEQKLMINLLKPKYFIPVHGEFKHLKRHAQTAEALGIPKSNIVVADTGDTISVSRDGIRLGEPVPSGAVMVDGLGVGDVGSVVLRDRRLLSQDGIVVLAASIDAKSGKLVSGPELFSRGFVYVRESEELLEQTRQAVQKVLEKNESETYRDVGSLKTRIRETASSLLYRKTKRSPMILPILMETDGEPGWQ